MRTVGDRPPDPLPSIPAGGTARTTGNLSALGGYANELQYFIECVATGKPPALATLDQSIVSLGVVLAEVKSATVGRAVTINATSR